MTSTELCLVRPSNSKQYGAYLCDLVISQGRPGRQGPLGAAGEKGSRVSCHTGGSSKICLVENENLSLPNISDCLQKVSSKRERDVNVIAGS